MLSDDGLRPDPTYPSLRAPQYRGKLSASHTQAIAARRHG
jgi:hypothetical protein